MLEGIAGGVPHFTARNQTVGAKPALPLPCQDPDVQPAALSVRGSSIALRYKALHCTNWRPLRWGG